MRKKTFIPIRNKIIYIQTILLTSLILVSSYFTISLIYKDKKSYLYDNLYSHTKTNTLVLDRFFEQKKKISKIFFNLLNSENGNFHIENEFKSDKDLLLLKEFHFDDDGLPYSVTHYKNAAFFKKYRKLRIIILDNDKQYINTLERIKNSNEFIINIIYEETPIPFLEIAQYYPDENKVIYAKFILDNILSTVFSDSVFDSIIFKDTGSIIYNNKPFKLKHNQVESYITNIKQSENSQRIIEFEQANKRFMTSFRRLAEFPNLYIINEIESSKAFSVTKALIIQMIVYALSFIGIFNIVSIFFSRSLTKPIESLLTGIQHIKDGNYEHKIKIQTKDELATVGSSFNEMSETILDYKNEIEEYNKKLEEKVEQRTEELNKANKFINTMINSIGQGLLVFTKNGFCLPTYTKACETIFGSSPANKKLSTVLEKEDESTQKWVSSLFEEMIPFKSLVEIGPTGIEKGENHNSEDYSYTHLEYFPMRGKDEKIENVVLVATDKTKEKKADKELELQTSNIKLISKSLKNKDILLSTINLVNEFVKIEFDHFTREHDNPKTELLLILHSLKGSCGMFNFTTLEKSIHQFETDLTENDLNKEWFTNVQNSLESNLDNSIEHLKSQLGDNFFNNDERTISETTIEFIKSSLLKDDDETKRKFDNILNSKDVKDFITPYIGLTEDLAKKLKKKINPIQISSEEVLLNKDTYTSFFNSCVHLFRNTIDHGIEKPLRRKNKNKNEKGTIEINISKNKVHDQEILILEIKDDGKGIDPEAIRKKMKMLKYPNNLISKNDEDIIYHIFDSEFSTAQTVNNLSGRGVGLHDIKREIEKLNGDILISSRVDQGTVFKIQLPIT